MPGEASKHIHQALCVIIFMLKIRGILRSTPSSWYFADCRKIQSRWKGFVARRAFLRDRRRRWIEKRSQSLRLHQDRRWKWIDTKDHVLARRRNSGFKVCANFTCVYSIMQLTATQKNGSSTVSHQQRHGHNSTLGTTTCW